MSSASGRQHYQPLSDAIPARRSLQLAAGSRVRPKREPLDNDYGREQEPDQHSSEDPSSGTSHDRQSLDPLNIVAGPSGSPSQSGIKRKPGRPKGSKTKKRRRLDSSTHNYPQTNLGKTSADRHFTATSATIPRVLSSTPMSESDRKFSEFQWRVLTLCNEFYEAAAELFSSSPDEMKELYDLDDNSSVTPLTVINDAKRTCDYILQKPHAKLVPRDDSNLPSGAATDAATSTTLENEPAIAITEDHDLLESKYFPPSLFPSEPTASTSTAPIPEFLLTPESSPYGRGLLGTNLESIALPHLHMNQQQGAWTDEESERLSGLAEEYRSGNGEIDWDQVVNAFGVGRSRHQILIKATSMGLKPSSTRPSRQRQREARLAAQAAAATAAAVANAGGGESTSIAPPVSIANPLLPPPHPPLPSILGQLAPQTSPLPWTQPPHSPYFGMPTTPQTPHNQGLDDGQSPNPFIWPAPADMNGRPPSFDFR